MKEKQYEEVIPTWTEAINIHLMCLANPMASDKAKLGAREEILRCAKGLDKARAEIKTVLGDVEDLKSRLNPKLDKCSTDRALLRYDLGHILEGKYDRKEGRALKQSKAIGREASTGDDEVIREGL